MFGRENRNIMIMSIIEMLDRKGLHEGFLIRILTAALLLHHVILFSLVQRTCPESPCVSLPMAGM